MATEVRIPAMGESISSGILAAWHVKDGDFVEKDQVLYELETDKITSEGSAEVSGVISLKAEVEDEVDIGQVVATIDESASGSSSAADKQSSADTASAETSTEASAEPAAAAATAAETSSEAKPLSPAARKAAKETGVDTSKISGSGKDGRVTKSDILEAAKAPAPAASPAPAPASAPKASSDPAPAGERKETRKKMSPLRRKIAQRLVAATQEAAMLTTFNEVDMSAVMKLRKQHQEKFVERHGLKLGFMSF
ncbi:MAG TPA: dihydrolipoamide succinyltransferase, partial [Opitutae bacterium]|nr:dihydrolipoamide succinyltransferase [Opitutae bacterium]